MMIEKNGEYELGGKSGQMGQKRRLTWYVTPSG
jgi:beta-lactamase class D